MMGRNGVQMAQETVKIAAGQVWLPQVNAWGHVSSRTSWRIDGWPRNNANYNSSPYSAKTVTGNLVQSRSLIVPYVWIGDFVR